MAPWASAPPVGPAGDTYYNTGNKALYISDGTTWNQIQAGGGGGGAPYAPVTGTPPNPSSPTVTPPTGLLWVDTSTTPSWAPIAGPTGPAGPTGAVGPTGPGLVDYGVTAADLNTLTASGTYVASDANTNAPPLIAGQYFLTVNRCSAGAFIEQQATLITNPAYIATRLYLTSTGVWGGWKSPPAGVLWTGNGPPTAYSGGAGTYWTVAPGAGVIAGRRYRASLVGYITNNSGAATSFMYATITDQVVVVFSNPRWWWNGANTNIGQSNGFGVSAVGTAASTGVPSWALGVNASGSPVAVGQNGHTFTLEDLGY